MGEQSLVLGNLLDVLYTKLFSSFGEKVGGRANDVS